MIARRVRDLGVYAEVQPSETLASKLEGRRGIIISGGPASVYAAGSPSVDPEIFDLGVPVLGICYGMQLMAHLQGGRVNKGVKGEYGMAQLEMLQDHPIFEGVEQFGQIWMNHRDLVAEVPDGFEVTARTSTCPIAGMANDWRKHYGLQFHPEVVHTIGGKIMLGNFVFAVAGCERDWEPMHQLEAIEDEIRRTARGRNVFFFASGGVDSTVAFRLCLKALGKERVCAAYVDTGLMREGETEFVREIFTEMAGKSFEVVDAQAQFLGKLEGVIEPEQKRKIIGEEFVAVQQRVLEGGAFLSGQWILGQGTIYPDTIESGGTAKADLIKTHHNRVEGIQRLIDEGRLVEPLSQFYKDEVRQVGRAIGLPDALLDRHPFPGPGLAIRCLGSEVEAALVPHEFGFVMPVSSVGVQGDERTYRAALALPVYALRDFALSTELVNSIPEINRVVALVRSAVPLEELKVLRAGLDAERLGRLRRCDAIVRRISLETGYDEQVWQFPVVLLPCGVPGKPDSVVLRPVDSVDGMSAVAVPMPEELLGRLAGELMAVEGIAAVFYDVTNKPPATIEWE